ncbi:MAG TPA: hypothetical protein VIR02_05310, partial [Anaerolineales bacterium]
MVGKEEKIKNLPPYGGRFHLVLSVVEGSKTDGVLLEGVRHADGHCEGQLSGLDRDKFGKGRVRNTPIIESGVIGAALGL